MLRRQLERYGRWLIVIGILAAAGLSTAGYILVHQRFPLPWEKRYTIQAEFATTAGLNPPGLGQAVNVAGVRVGTIADTRLREGRAIADLEIDPGKLPRVYRNATAVLVPNTPLKDMLIELYPGRPPARTLRPGETIHISATNVPVDSDELTAALDADTRDFMQLLMIGFDQGTRRRGHDLRAVLKSLGPTAEQLRSIGAALAARRTEMSRLVHNLRVLSQAAAVKDREIAQLVVTANSTLDAVAREEAPLRASLDRLPGTLGAVRRSLRNTTRFSHELKPTLDAAQPVVERLPGALAAARPLLDETEPLLRNQVRPLVQEAEPVVDDLGPTVTKLHDVSADLITTLRVLTHVVNQLAYNPPGDDEGGLFWLAWFAHNGNSLVSSQDAHGSVVHGLILFDCSFVTAVNPLLALVLGNFPNCP